MWVIGAIFGFGLAAWIAKLILQNQQDFYENKLNSEKILHDVTVQYNVERTKNDIMQEVIITQGINEKRAYEMFFKMADIAIKNAQQPTQLYPKPLPSLAVNGESNTENAVYTPNLTQNTENKQVGEGKHVSNLALKTGVADWLLSKNARLLEGKKNIVIEMNGLKYVCDYPEEKGKTNKVSDLPLHLGRCFLDSCNSNFLSTEQSSRYCCEQHKNLKNNSK